MKTKQIIEVFILALLVFLTSITLYKVLWIDNKIDSVDGKLSTIQKDIDEGFTIIVE